MVEANYQSLNRSISSTSHHVADEIEAKIKIKEQFKQQLANGEFNFAVSSDYGNNPYEDLDKSQIDPRLLRNSIQQQSSKTRQTQS